MQAAIPIEYRDYWDYPRIFLVRYRGRLYLFDCEFDKQAEDFRDDYKIYLMPELTTDDRNGSWFEFPRQAIRQLGTVPVESVAFADPEKKSLVASYLEELLREPARRTG